MAHIGVEPKVALARALEGPAVLASPGVAPLLGIARAISALPVPSVDPAFIARLEARLMAEPAERTEEAPGRRLRVVPDTSRAPDAVSVPANVVALPRRRFVVRRSLAAAIAVAMLSALPVLAAGSALPGSILYPVKTGIERLHLALTRGPIADGFLLLNHADRRLDEVDQLVALGRTELVPATLDRMERAMRAGTNLILRYARDQRTLQRLADRLRGTTGRISMLLANAPAGVKPDLVESLATGTQLARQVDAALRAAGPVAPPATPGGTDVSQDVAHDLPVATNVAPLDPSDYEKYRLVETGEQPGGDDTDSSQTDSPCLAKMYVGPGAPAAHSACATITNERRRGTEPPAPTDGQVTREVGSAPPPQVAPPPPPPEPAPQPAEQPVEQPRAGQVSAREEGSVDQQDEAVEAQGAGDAQSATHGKNRSKNEAKPPGNPDR